MSNNISVEIDNDLEAVYSSVIALIDLSEKTTGGNLEDVLKFNQTYLSITQKMSDIANKLIKFDQSRTNKLWDKFDSINDDLNYIYDTSSIPINSVLVENTIELQESYKKTQGLQLAVFSIVLTILAFVLTNAKILAAEAINFKNVLLVNLSFILSSDFLFSLIYLFMGPVFYSKRGALRVFTFVIFPIILISAIVCIALFMK